MSVLLAVACGPPLADADASSSVEEGTTGTTRSDGADPPGTSAEETTGSTAGATSLPDAMTSSPDATTTSSDATTSSVDTTADVTTGSPDPTTGALTDASDTTGTVIEQTASSSEAVSSSSTGGESSSSTGEAFATCYTEAWAVAIPEVSSIWRPAVDPNGLIFVAAWANGGDDGWVGAWSLDGAAQWSYFVDPVALGLEDDTGNARDIDVLADGDALLSYWFTGDDSAAVFARLDADTGDVVWSANLDGDELWPLDPEFGISGGVASNAAVTASGRVFVHGTTSGAFGEPVFVAELDESDGSVLSLTQVSYLDMGVNGYGSDEFLADDVAGLFREWGISYFGPYSAGGFDNLSLDGELLNGIGPADIVADGESVGCSSYALAPDGNIGLSCS